MQIAYFKWHFGAIKITDNDGISSLEFVKEYKKTSSDSLNLELCFDELDRYFSGNLREFSVKLISQGGGFNKDVYDALLRVKYGTTVTYKELATMINRPKAYRAVGNANSKNRIPIIIPCHRVVGVNGLGGYSANFGDKNTSLEIKQYLLDLEKKFS
ncbi:MAG: methylated-DNA--[protein]-cysteine S-methyltransferase [Campylobacter sp.]|nr:methylated-DNA--[protein]-cysteine S-methyltransferase [Campylobacter sp.]